MEARIELIERLNLSVNGNPRFRITYTEAEDITGSDWIPCQSAITQSDAAFNYEVGNPGLRAGDTVVLSFTRAGRINGIKRDESMSA